MSTAPGPLAEAADLDQAVYLSDPYGPGRWRVTVGIQVPVAVAADSRREAIDAAIELLKPGINSLKDRSDGQLWIPGTIGIEGAERVHDD